MIEQLFGSKTRVKLLQLFLGNPNRPYYVREITRKIDEQINSVRRELANLLSIGIISSETSDNNRLYYEVNQKYDYYEALSVIFGRKADAPIKKSSKKAKSDGTPAQEQDPELAALGNVEIALYTGQFTRDERSTIDVLIVGDVNQTRLNKFIADLESKEGKEIRYAVMPLSEFDYRRQINDRFLADVLISKNQVLVDKHGRLNKIKTEE